MATTVLQFPCVIPAGTLPGAPAVVPLALSNWIIESFDLEVPPGPYGNVGFALYRSGTQVVPYQAGTWIVWDDQFRNWPMDDLPTGSGWQLVAYNTGVDPHTVTVRAHCSPIVAQTPPPPTVTFVTVATSDATPAPVDVGVNLS